MIKNESGLLFIFCSMQNFQDLLNTSTPVHRGAFCQYPFRWIYYYGTGKKIGKTHVCAVYRGGIMPVGIVNKLKKGQEEIKMWVGNRT